MSVDRSGEVHQISGMTVKKPGPAFYPQDETNERGSEASSRNFPLDNCRATVTRVSPF